jgi:hypothetical protein
VEKILELFKLTNQQLKTLLIISVSLLSIIFILGERSGKFSSELQTITKNIVENKEAINNINTEIMKNRLLTQAQLNKLYKDIIEIQNLDKQVADDKLKLIMKYSIKSSNDREIIETLFKIEDQKRNSELKEIQNENEHVKLDTSIITDK